MAGPIAFYSPDPIQSTQLIPGGNTPASGAQLFVYQVGTSTKQNSYTDATASTARTNPIVLDSGGNIPGNGEVWITSSAKFVLAPSNDTDPPSSPYWTRDGVPGINNITAGQVQALSSANEWVLGTVPTFVGVTAFTVTGDQTTTYTLGRRVKATVTGGDRFGIVTSQTLATGSTTVGVLLDSSTLNGGLSAVSYGLLSTPNGSVPWTQYSTSGSFAEGPITFLNVAHNDAQSTVTSSANPNIWGGGNVINFTGTTTVSSFATAPQAGATRSLIISGSTTVTFTTSAALSINGGSSSFVASIGDKVDIVATSTGFFFAYPSTPIQSGTWVPSVGGTATYNSQVGNYIKAGKLVYIQMLLQINAIGTGSQTGVISGLPFASAGNNRVIPIGWQSLSTTATCVLGQINGSQINLIASIVASSTIGVNTIVTSGTAIQTSGFYDAAT